MVPSLYDPSGNCGPTMSLHVLPRNRCTPSIPPVLHVLESLEVPYIPSTLSKQLYFICKYLYTPQWPHEHFVQAKRISTIFWNNIIRVDDIPSTFTHLVGTTIQTNVWVILQNIIISNFCNLAKIKWSRKKKSNSKLLSHQLIMKTSTRCRPYRQLLFLGSNQSNLSLSLQKPICLHGLYKQYTQPVTAFISNNKITMNM